MGALPSVDVECGRGGHLFKWTRKAKDHALGMEGMSPAPLDSRLSPRKGGVGKTSQEG